MLPKSNAPWIVGLNKRLSHMVQSGLVERAKLRYIPDRLRSLLPEAAAKRQSQNQAEHGPFEFKHVQGLVIVHGFFLSLALFVFVLEHLTSVGSVTRRPLSTADSAGRRKPYAVELFKV